MHKIPLIILLVFFFVGCSNERVAQISTPDAITQKEFIFIFPSMPEAYCYSDMLTEQLNVLGESLNSSNFDVLSTSQPQTCRDLGYTRCESMIDEEKNTTIADYCTNENETKSCTYYYNMQQTDADDNYFDATCIAGSNYK